MSTKDYSSKQEKMIADYLNWKVVVGSGSRACHPGDIISDDWLGECKTHTKVDQPVFFSSDVWTKICNEASFQHRNPVLFSDDGSQKINRTWCMINHFAVEDGGRKLPIQKKFNKNFTMKHAELDSLYNIDGIINGTSEPICYLAGLNRYSVVILPLPIFRYMFE